MASSSRQTILFHSRTSFTSSSDFFSACRAALRDQYAWPAAIYRSDLYAASMRCGRRKHDAPAMGCPFRVEVRNLEHHWVLDEDRTCWKHSHGNGADEANRTAGRSEHSASDESGRPAKKKKVESSPQHPVDFPAPGTRFPSFKALQIAVAVPHLDTYGYNLQPINQKCCDLACARAHYRVEPSADKRCPFRFQARHEVVGMEEAWVVGGPLGEHNHPPAPQLFDPGWRPHIFDPEVKAAYIKSKKTPTRRVSTAAPSASLPLSSSFFTPPFTSLSSPTPTSIPALAAAPSVSASNSNPAPAPADSALHAFLVGSHPSLASLAPHFASIGLDSTSSMITLASLEPAILNALLDELVSSSACRSAMSRSGSKPQVESLKKLLKDARQMGWIVT